MNMPRISPELAAVVLVAFALTLAVAVAYWMATIARDMA